MQLEYLIWTIGIWRTQATTVQIAQEDSSTFSRNAGPIRGGGGVCVGKGADQHGKISNVLLGRQDLEALAHAQLHLLLLLLGLASLDLWHHSALQAPVDGGDQEATDDDHAHHALERVAPAIHTVW